MKKIISILSIFSLFIFLGFGCDSVLGGRTSNSGFVKKYNNGEITSVLDDNITNVDFLGSDLSNVGSFTATTSTVDVQIVNTVASSTSYDVGDDGISFVDNSLETSIKTPTDNELNFTAGGVGVLSLSNGYVGFGQDTQISNESALFVGGNGVLHSNTVNTSVAKGGRFGTLAYNSSQNPFYFFSSYSDASNNIANWGGGTSVGQASTKLQMLLADSVNTNVGTTVTTILPRKWTLTPFDYTNASSDDYAMSISQTLNDASAPVGTENYSLMKLLLTETDSTAWGGNVNYLALGDTSNNVITFGTDNGIVQNDQYGNTKTQVTSVQTTDATITNLAVISTDSNTVKTLRAVVSAVKSDGSQLGSYELIGAFKNNAGTLTQVGATTNVHTIEDDATWDVSFAVAGTDIYLKVTGVLATTIDWASTIEITEVQ